MRAERRIVAHLAGFYHAVIAVFDKYDYYQMQKRTVKAADIVFILIMTNLFDDAPSKAPHDARVRAACAALSVMAIFCWHISLSSSLRRPPHSPRCSTTAR